MICYRKGYKYQLQKDYICKINIRPPETISTSLIELTVHGFLKIKALYCWDGPSGPMLDTKSAMRGSLVHDVLYQLLRQGLLPESDRREADCIFRDMCRADGMSKFRSWYAFKALRVAGGAAADPKNKKEILSAP